MGDSYEYRIIRLVNETEGVRAVESTLNAYASDGWRLLSLQLPGGLGIMERETRKEAQL